MSDEHNSRGRLVTFYSYKGGVGRTMALANVAFLAAANDLDVLMMDWDLEAPGLYHYFRGLMEPEVMSQLRNAKGVLDLAWQWKVAFEEAETEGDLEAVISRFESGQAFREVVHSIEQEETAHFGGKLDMIPAGSALIDAHVPMNYEQALADLSWSEFLDLYAGGRMISALREWAISEYDLVLIDSRTGLADVAGICTMQMPDMVMLTFVLNRQNIEGVARVAAAIKAHRGSEIELRTVPMRVSRENTEEEADATARALRELTRVGGMNAETVERDLQELVVKAEPSIPFMESLAVFNETKAALDPFTADMARLTIEILGQPIAIPEIDDAWRSTVLGRLSPTMATNSYLRQLETADPRRALILVNQYVESALSSLAEGEEPSSSYLESLVDSAFHTWSRAEAADEIYGLDTIDRLVTLLRKLTVDDRELWTPSLVRALETALYSDTVFHTSESEFVIVEEIDELLSALPQTAERLLHRAELKLRMSRQLTDSDDSLPRLTIVEDALKLLDAASSRGGLADRQTATIRIEGYIQKADALAAAVDELEAIATLEAALKILDDIDDRALDSDAENLRFEIEYRLMKLFHAQDSGGAQAIEHAERALSEKLASSANFLIRVGDFATVLESSTRPEPGVAIPLLRCLLDRTFVRSTVRYFARSPVRIGVIVDALRTALENVGERLGNEQTIVFKTESVQVLEELVASLESRFTPVLRRGVGRSSGQNIQSFLSSVENLEQTLLANPTTQEIEQGLTAVRVPLENLRNSISNRSRNQQSHEDDV